MPSVRAPRRTRELTEEVVEHGVARLNQLDEARQSKRARCARAARDAANDDNDPGDSMSLVFDRFVLTGGETIMQTTNFSEEEVNRADGQSNQLHQALPGACVGYRAIPKNQCFHSQNTKKSEVEKRLHDAGPLVTKYPNEWALLADKGYQGLSSNSRAITPHKKQPGETVSIEQLEENDKIAHDRVLVENYFGCLATLWSVCSDKHRWAESRYDILFRTCVALTNFHVHLNPLRDGDCDSYRDYLGRLPSIGEEMASKRKTSQKCYRSRRDQRLRSMFRVRHGLEEPLSMRHQSESSNNSDATLFGH